MRDRVGKNLARGIVQGFHDEDPMSQIKADIEASLGAIQTSMVISSAQSNRAQISATEQGVGAGMVINFNDVQTSPDAIAQKMHQINTYGPARSY